MTNAHNGRANAQAMLSDRRVFLRGALTAGAAASIAAIPVIAEAAETDDLPDRLWAERHALRQPYKDAWAAVFRVEAQMPEWARPGPELLNPDGTIGGHEGRWPAMQGVKPCAKGPINVRPGHRDLKAEYDWNRIFRPATAVAEYRLARRALRAPLRARRIEEERVGLPELRKAVDRVSVRREAIQGKIERMKSNTPNAAAARVLLELAIMAWFQQPLFGDDPTHEAMLEFLRPSLTGLIRDHVDEALDNPDLPAGMLQAVHAQRASYELEDA